VRGIANLVSSSVEGLKPDTVTITDGTGRMLWPQGGEGADGMSTTSKTVAEDRYANQLESSLNALLMRTVGPDKAQVKVKADLDVDQVKEKRLEYAKRGTPLARTTEEERLRGEGGGGLGAGTRANIPTYQAAAGAAGGGSNYRKRSEQTEFGVNKTIVDAVRAPGTVNRLDVALVLDKSLARARRLERAIAGAAGVQVGRATPVGLPVAFAKQAAVAPQSGDRVPRAPSASQVRGLG
jgi:flagellar M-ring protein FliF